MLQIVLIIIQQHEPNNIVIDRLANVRETVEIMKLSPPIRVAPIKIE
jgi:hypothetical protein